MQHGADRFLEILGSVSDGAEIDWERAERDCQGEEERSLLRSLRIVAQVSAFHEGPAAGAPVADARVSLAPGDRFEHLRIRERLGGGAWGEVYRAEDTRLGRDVALKLIQPHEGHDPSEGRYLAEARLLAMLNHPNVVAIHSVETDAQGRVALVLEYLTGRTLFDLIAHEGPRGTPEIVAVGVELCRALAAVHGAGLVHRDVKAQNVMRDASGRIVLMDFGPGGGTPLYMAPELFAGAEPTPRSDFYAFGVLLFYLATGRYPIRGESVDELRRAQAAGRRRWLRDLRPDLPAALVQLVDRCLEPDPHQRPETAGWIERSLGACLTGPTSATRPRALVPRAVRKSQLFAAGIAVAGIAVLVLVAIFWRQHNRSVQGPPAPLSSAASGLPYSVEARAWNGRGRQAPLTDGSIVALGDSISLTLRASRDLYVYVINEDDAGEIYLLFPSPEFSPTNPLPADQPHVLPGRRRNRDVYWQVTSPGGRERILLVAGPERLATLEAEAERLPRPAKDQPVRYAKLPPEALKQELRGIGGWVESSPSGELGLRALFDRAPILRDREEETRGVWIRRLELRNSGR